MDLPLTRELLPEVIWREASPSTNAELRELALDAAAQGDSGALPHLTLLATANQTAGRGRQGRGWVTPPDSALAASLLVRGFERSGLGPGWLPLIAGAALAQALQPFYGEGMRVGVKWPNDVHVRDENDAMEGRPGLKLCGILCEMLGDGAVIVGTGINLLIPEWELPTDRATSLLASGADIAGADGSEPVSLADPAGLKLADRVLSGYAAAMQSLTALAAENPGAARARVMRSSVTLGSEVRVHLPGGEIAQGFARRLADDGSLVVERPLRPALVVSAGDVEHLR